MVEELLMILTGEYDTLIGLSALYLSGYNCWPKVPGTLTKNFLKYSPLSIQTTAPCKHPFPREQCYSVNEILKFIVHGKFFHCRLHFSHKPTLFRGGVGGTLRAE